METVIESICRLVSLRLAMEEKENDDNKNKIVLLDMETSILSIQVPLSSRDLIFFLRFPSSSLVFLGIKMISFVCKVCL